MNLSISDVWMQSILIWVRYNFILYMLSIPYVGIVLVELQCIVLVELQCIVLVEMQCILLVELQCIVLVELQCIILVELQCIVTFTAGEVKL